MKRFASVISIVLFAGLSGCQPSNDQFADTIFYGDHIITMDSANSGAKAIAIQGETIVFAGSREDSQRWLSDDTRVVELGERALLPGFIDSHGHISMVAATIDFLNVASPPVGPVNNIDDILNLLRGRIQATNADEGDWILANGYDDSLLAEKRHPTREDLDKVSKDIPIYLLHVSGHLGTANSAALAAMGINADTPDPAGGLFRRFANSREPNGVMEEEANHKMMGLHMVGHLINPFRLIESVEKTVEYYASRGITTIQDGGSDYRVGKVMRALSLFTPIPMDIVIYQAAFDAKPAMSTEKIQKELADGYDDNVRFGGIKLMLDGSPQGRTAWMTQPYNENPAGIEGDYVAYPTTQPDLFKETAGQLLRQGVPILVHANGDAAIDVAMDAVEEAFQGEAIPDHRTVIIHSQVMRPDQVVRAAKLKVVPSFFASHSYFWGDWHRKSFGEERAAHISPAKAALDHGVNFTIHNDTPVVPPDMMRLIWAAVNRETRSGFILGPDQRISAYDALYSVTLGGAYQYFEEHKKGSLSVGKQADLVMLGSNPLSAEPSEIKDIPVLETIAHGKTIYHAEN